MQEFIAEDSVTFEGENLKSEKKAFFVKAAAMLPRAKCTFSAAATKKGGTRRRGGGSATASLRPKRGKGDVRASQPTYFQCKLTYKVLKTGVFEAFNVNNQCISADSSVLAWKKKREWLTSHCVFHSIRFKVNKVGIQWYPIFFAPWPPSMTVSPFFPLGCGADNPGTRNSFRAQ